MAKGRNKVDYVPNADGVHLIAPGNYGRIRLSWHERGGPGSRSKRLGYLLVGVHQKTTHFPGTTEWNHAIHCLPRSVFLRHTKHWWIPHEDLVAIHEVLEPILEEAIAERQDRQRTARRAYFRHRRGD